MSVPASAQRLHIYDLKATPKKITLKWDPSPQPPWSPPSQDPANPMTPSTVVVSTFWNMLNRTPSGSGLPFNFTTQTTYDDGDWLANTQYQYWLTGSDVYYTKAFNAQTSSWYWAGPNYTARTWPSVYVSVRAVGVSAAATADSRLDLRFATEHLLDYTFNNIPAATGGGTTLFRGGLFAGFQQDSSRVGRSYLRFTNIVPTVSTGNLLWPIGGLQLYVPRLAKTGSVSLTTRTVSNESFDASALVWSNAPTLGSSLARSASVIWNATSPAGQWISVNVSPDIEDAIKSDNILSLALMSGNETSAGWAYLARPGFSDPTYTLPANSLTPPNGLGPYLLFGLLGPGANISSLTVSPTSVTSGTSTTVQGTITLSCMAPQNGFEISLASNNSAVTVPASVVIPMDGSSVTFPITWSSVTNTTIATITAVLGNSKTATLTVVGNGGGGGGSGTIDTLVISPNSVAVGASATGTITLTAAAPMGGVTVNLASNNTNAAQVPASVTVPSGMTTKTFTVTTGPGYAYYQPATITATATNSKTASIYVHP